MDGWLNRQNLLNGYDMSGVFRIFLLAAFGQKPRRRLTYSFFFFYNGARSPVPLIYIAKSNQNSYVITAVGERKIKTHKHTHKTAPKIKLKNSSEKYCIAETWISSQQPNTIRNPNNNNRIIRMVFRQLGCGDEIEKKEITRMEIKNI